MPHLHFLPLPPFCQLEFYSWHTRTQNDPNPNASSSTQDVYLLNFSWWAAISLVISLFPDAFIWMGSVSSISYRFFFLYEMTNELTYVCECSIEVFFIQIWQYLCDRVVNMRPCASGVHSSSTSCFADLYRITPNHNVLPLWALGVLTTSHVHVVHSYLPS